MAHCPLENIYVSEASPPPPPPANGHVCACDLLSHLLSHTLYLCLFLSLSLTGKRRRLQWRKNLFGLDKVEGAWGHVWLYDRYLKHVR